MSLSSAGAAAGNIGSIMSLVSLPFELGAKNAQQAEAVYASRMQKYANIKQASDALNDEQRNIAALEQNAILSDLTIESNQRQAEAAAKVQAATVGAEGGSVSQVIQTTEINEAQAKGANAVQLEEALDQSFRNIESHAYSLSMATAPEFESDAMSDMFGAIFGMSPLVFGTQALMGD